ncbi:hypothetical protein SOM11_06880 [Frigoribacterium sp. CFBP9039]|uniref:hypothetical protein n=1 Tax=Frigoribacterium sp. CFBP9029 TaxID=3096541 RepID=UPI002A69E2A7|nr:hypothetical protein [Frigoribacterium sp. CFBP9039]MDY0945709.1 hypothetical protein [Frigoribacterium sp. CFBP9039]
MEDHAAPTTPTATSETRPTRACTTRRRLRAGALAALGVAGIAALTGCSSMVSAAEEALGSEQVQQRHYDTYADAPSSRTSDDVAWFMPDWVPADARDIDVRLDTEQPGYELSFTSAEGVDLDACEPVDGDLGGPAMPTETLPQPLPTTGLVSCGDGRVTATVDDRWASWTTLEAVPGDDGGSTLRR